MSTLFALTSAGCVRAEREALRNVSFRLNQGEFVALCGLNGAGKSTLLEIMSGLLRDYSGSCVFQGREVREWTPRTLAQHISFLPQASAGLGQLSSQRSRSHGKISVFDRMERDG